MIMKKIWVWVMVVILLFLTVIPAFADAVSYLMDPVDYYVYVDTPDGGLNMRYGPGVDYARVIDYRIPDGMKLHITYESDNWGYTEYKGSYGWVALSQTSSTPLENNGQSVDYYVYVNTPDGGLNMRYGPGVDYDRVIDYRIPDGTKLHIMERYDNWGYTTYDGEYGWVALKQTSETPPVLEKTSVAEEITTEQELTTLGDSTKPAEKDTVTETLSFADDQNDVNNDEDTEKSNSPLSRDFILVGVIVLLVIVIALLMIIIVNIKAKNKEIM